MLMFPLQLVVVRQVEMRVEERRERDMGDKDADGAEVVPSVRATI